MPFFFNNYIQNWWEQNPNARNLLAVLNWTVNHPWLGLILAILSLVIISKIVKAVDRFLEITGLSLIKAIFNLIWRGLKGTIIAVGRLTGLGWEKLFTKSSEEAIDPSEAHPPLSVAIEKQQRLQEIQTRLEALNQEQKELLQEASQLLVEGKRLNLPEALNIKLNNSRRTI